MIKIYLCTFTFVILLSADFSSNVKEDRTCEVIKTDLKLLNVEKEVLKDLELRCIKQKRWRMYE